MNDTGLIIAALLCGIFIGFAFGVESEHREMWTPWWGEDAPREECEMSTSHVRGHEVHYEEGTWRYSDNTDSVALFPRPCLRCEEPPTPEGYDACTGHVEGATSVCCGHGVTKPIRITEGDGT